MARGAPSGAGGAPSRARLPILPRIPRISRISRISLRISNDFYKDLLLTISLDFMFCTGFPRILILIWIWLDFDFDLDLILILILSWLDFD